MNTKFEIIVYKSIGFENGIEKYEQIYNYFGNDLTLLANTVYYKLEVSDWENDDFIDSVNYSFCNNSFVSFKSNCIDEQNLRLQVKKIF